MKAAADDNITVTGSPMQVRVIQLNLGWNLVGCPFKSATPFESGLVQRGYSNQTGLSSIKNFDGFLSVSNPLSTIQQFEPGKGYFILLKN